MSTKWTPARIELAKQCYGVWTCVYDEFGPSEWLLAQGYAEERAGTLHKGGPYIKLTPAGRDALDREIGDTT